MRKAVCAAIMGGLIASTPAEASAYDATKLVVREAHAMRVPVNFALKMARIESGVKCNNHNRRSTASGPLQITAPSARSLGYRGNIRKASCATQTHYGMKHLAMCYHGAHGNQALARRCHQTGIAVLYGRKRHRH